MSNTKHDQPVCKKCGARLMNKEVGYCTGCAGEVKKKFKIQSLGLAVGLTCLGTAIMYASEISNIPNFAKIIVFCFVIFGVSALYKIIGLKIKP